MAGNIYDLLKARYPSPEWAMFHEVNSGRTYGDALVMGMWGSSGYAVHGFELKASRSDWQREMKKPSKSDPIFKFCDYWWLLTTDKEIAKIEEIPMMWGWVASTGEKLKTIKPAPKLKAQTLTREFIAAVIRRGHEQMKEMIFKSEISEEIRLAVERGKQQSNYDAERHSRNFNEFIKEVSKFEEVSGLNIRDEFRWRFKDVKLGDAVKFVLDGGIEKQKQQLYDLSTEAKKICATIEKAVEIYKKMEEPIIETNL